MKSQRLSSVLSRGIAISALALSVVWAALVAAMWWGQERLLFEPKALASNLPIEAPDVTEDWVDVPGARLHAIQFRQPMVDGVRHTKGLIFYLHGNVGNVATWFVDPVFWRASGYDLYMMDYRGFGKSTGRIENEAQLHADVQTAWERIAPGYAGLKTVIFGRSLGTGLAVRLAATVQPDLLILVSPYSSMTAVMNVHYPWAPDAILRYPLASDHYIQQVRHATLIFHGLRDAVIPAAQAEALQKGARRAELILLPNVGHEDVQEDTTYRNTLLGRLRDL
jgi:uncharacterized protein